MKHNHTHSCECKHESVKYCSHCRTVYCEGCNQEWTAKSNHSYYPWGYYNQPNTVQIPKITYGSGGTNEWISKLQGVFENTNKLDDGHTVTVSTSNHTHCKK